MQLHWHARKVTRPRLVAFLGFLIPSTFLWLLGDHIGTVLFYQPGYDILDPMLYERAKLFALIILTLLFAAVAFLSLERYHLSREATSLAEEMVSDLMLSREQFRMLYESSPIPYFLMDDVGNIRNPNRAALRFLEGTEEECVVTNFYSLIAENDEAVEDMVLLRTKVEHAVPINREEKGMQTIKGNHREVYVSIYSLDRTSPIPFRHLVTLVDVTKEHESERVKTDFLLLASHQLRTPLTTIKWYIDYLLTSKSINLSGQVREYLEQVYIGSERMIELVTTLLTVSRIEMGTLQPEHADVHVCEVVRDLLTEFEPDLQNKDIEVKSTCVGDDKVISDRNMIRIAIHNLLTNAIKYTRPKTQIRVDAHFGAQSCTITVSDKGYGIPLNEQQQIFTKMFRATNARSVSAEGTGLGLYLTKSFVEKLGGEIEFTSEENVGTTFTITLPRVAPNT